MSGRRTVGAAVLLGGAVVAGMTGCGVVQTTPNLPADAFVANHPVIGEEAGQGTDHSGPLVYDDLRRPTKPISPSDHISQTVRDEVKSPTEETLAVENGTDFPPPGPKFLPPTTQGARGVSTGEFMWVGSVLAVVNEEPIYADKVLSTLERALRAEAQADSEDHFRSVASDLIGKQVREFIDNDLEYAAAKKALDKKDEQLAHFVTAEWRKDQIRRAGGSEAQARQRAADDGVDFDEEVQQQFRINMIRIYYQNKMMPQIQISAQDIRNYYQQNLRQFQQAAAAKFRVIFISTEKTGGPEAAVTKAREIYRRALKGENFEDLAGKFNDDPGLMRKKGTVGDQNGWMEKGAFAVAKVEDAIWDMKPGDVSPPIPAPDRGDNGFWLAKLEEIHPGVTDSFENQKVQDAIHEVLRKEQLARLREIHRRKLIGEAVIVENPNELQVATDMVMQRYRLWSAAK